MLPCKFPLADGQNYSCHSAILLPFCAQVPIVKERRRFTDVLDEEAAIKYERKMEAWGRDDFSVYKPARLLGGPGGGGEGEEDTTQEVTSRLRRKSVDFWQWWEF